MKMQHLVSRGVLCTIGLTLVGLITTQQAIAVPIAVPNSSFESPVVGDGLKANNVITSWTLNPNGGAPSGNTFGVLNPTAGGLQPTDGQQYAYLDYAQNNGGGGPYLVPTIAPAISTAAGQVFTLTVDVASESINQNIGLFFLVNGVFSNSAFSNAAAVNVFETRSISQTSSAAGQTISFGLYSGTAGGAVRVFFDNVRLDGPAGTAVPEPATLGLVGLGLVAGMRRRVRR